ncbi:uncharacterized protein PHACADRAFT_210435 [Phanerochaete carnosa HHB-10118-sp]|uniref:Uncharacterized protein n=1 Tax=Phanerochaete carnosa (strain HHB-10118-sp) TaxID=650164 RepID=K5VSY9_PHACS|nr:uncharacterized protein PHACADRAFT_210435 [Phanerochaete carnosa HHB-10118-sp]EKM54638.1 hypothetical protein PHACADRAFT_210435 [Phanerochaete carnosa HHB-10118-sp]
MPALDGLITDEFWLLAQGSSRKPTLHYTMKVILSGLLLCGIALGNAVPSKRQTLGSPAALNVVQDGEILGELFVTGVGATATVTADTGTSFYISSDFDFLYADIDDTSHAYVNFQNFGTTCGTTGDLIFTTSDSNKCSSQGPFSVTESGVLQYESGPGSFLVCGTDQHIAFISSGSAPSGCANVELKFLA